MRTTQIVRPELKNRPPVKKGGHKMIPGAWLIAIMNGGLVRLGLREHYSIFDGLPPGPGAADDVAYPRYFTTIPSDSGSLRSMGGFYRKKPRFLLLD